MTANQKLCLDQLRSKMVSICTQYDMKQAKKPHHNIWALGLYFQAVDTVIDDLTAHPEKLTRTAIVENFTGRLCDALLRGLGFGLMTLMEAKTGIAEDAEVSQ